MTFVPLFVKVTYNAPVTDCEFYSLNRNGVENEGSNPSWCATFSYMITYTQYFDTSKFNEEQINWIRDKLKTSTFPLIFDDDAWNIFDGLYPVDKERLKGKMLGNLMMTTAGTIVPTMCI